ncbi:MAG: alkaline phosphatase [Thiovulaceae bacterium]|nr:alkaline phosphatase [Sulfurimonadaceae bacterium]
MKNLYLLFLVIIFFSTGCSNSNTENISVKAKNIILLIGDGMGPEHIKAAGWKEVGKEGKLYMETLSKSGYIRTSSADNLITDSAAAATAIATGVKTNNGVISLDPSLNKLITILEEAKALGKSVGLITNVQIIHATPAAFASHVESRANTTEIARQILDNEVDVLLGGGENYFLPNTTIGCFPEIGHRNDNRNLINEAIDEGYTYVCDSGSLEDINSSNVTKLIGLFSDEGMDRPFSPSLDLMITKAIEILAKNDKGFFLMVEGGQIDWASHANDAENAMNDTINFDKAVKIAHDFSIEDNETLIIITADHETGGMSTSLVSTGESSEDGPFYMPNGEEFYINWSTTGHTNSNVKVFAHGYNYNLFEGEHENIFIYEVMKESFGF